MKKHTNNTETDNLSHPNSRSILLYNVQSLQITASHELDNIYMFMALIENAIEKYTPNSEGRDHFNLKMDDVQIALVGSISKFTTLFNSYRQSYLYNLTLRHIVSHFESAYFDLLSIYLTEYPEHLVGKTGAKQIDIKDVVASRNKNEIIKHIIEKQLNELKYKGVSEWFKYLYDIENIKHLPNDVVGKFAEIKATRDLLVHNKGIVNKIYINKAGKYQRSEEGKAIEVTHEYVARSYLLVREIIEHIFKETVDKCRKTAYSKIHISSY